MKCENCVNWGNKDKPDDRMKEFKFKTCGFDKFGGLYYAARHPCHNGHYQYIQDRPK